MTGSPSSGGRCPGRSTGGQKLMRSSGLPATLHLYPDRVQIVCAGGRHEAVHPRVPLVGAVSYPTGQRAQELPALRAIVVTLRQRVQRVQRKNAKAPAPAPPPR